MADTDKAPLRILTCLHCNWVWASRIERPVRCPRCASRHWDLPTQPIGWPKGRPRKVTA